LFKGPYKSWLKFRPFCADKSEQNEAKGYFYAQSFFYQGSKFNEILKVSLAEFSKIFQCFPELNEI